MEKQTVDFARDAFLTGRSQPLKFRVQQLKSLQRLITERQGEIAIALKQDLNRVSLKVIDFLLLLINRHTLSVQNIKNTFLILNCKVSKAFHRDAGPC